MLTDILIQGIVVGAGWGLIAIAFGLITRVVGVFHIALGGLYGLGAYLYLGASRDFGLPMAIAWLAAVLISAIVGVLIDELVYQRITGLHGRRRQTSKLVAEAGPFVASLGVLIVLDSVVLLFYGATPVGGHRPEWGVLDILGARMSVWDLFKVAISLASVVALAWWLSSTKSGYAARALGESPEGASVVGINERSIRRILFAVTGAIAAVAGVMAMLSSPMVPGSGINVVLYAALMTLIFPNARIEAWWLASIMLGVLYTGAAVLYNSGMAEIVAQTVLLSTLVVVRIFVPQYQKARRTSAASKLALQAQKFSEAEVAK